MSPARAFFGKIFQRLARSSLGGWFLPWVLVRMSFAIPLNRLRDTANLLAFHHPVPGYPLHIVIMPKRKILSLADLNASHAALLVELFQTVHELVVELDLERIGYRLVVNGSRYQEVPWLHFHLISEAR